RMSSLGEVTVLVRRRPQPINLAHDLIGETDRVGDRANGCWNSGRARILRQASSREYGSGNQEHSLAAFIHEKGMLTDSLFVRYAMFVSTGLPRGEHATPTPVR